MVRRVNKAVAQRATEVVEILASEYPGTADELCALHHDGPFQLLVATILSAQCTDERVNMTTPAVFAAYPTVDDLAGAALEDLEELIRPTGFFRSKAKSLVGMATGLRDRYDGEVPRDIEDLTTLPGVGRKTANVILSVAFDLPGLPVDTHVGRLARRLRLTSSDDPEKVEADLDAMVPPQEWGTLSVRLILHGRRVCTARVAHCERCVLAGICPSVGITAKPSKPARPAKAKKPAPRTKTRQASIE
jgi:endonuclease III